MTLLSGIFWFAWSMSNYWNVYLQSIGFDASQVGVLNAICSSTSLASLPLWGIIADKIRSIRKVETILVVCTAFFWGIVPIYARIFPGALWPFFIGIPLSCFFKNPTSHFHENLIVRNCNELKVDYGRLRWFGSLMTTIGSFALFWIADKTGNASTFWMFALCLIPVAIMTATARNPQGADSDQNAPKGKKNKLDLATLFRCRPYIFLLIYAVIYYIARNLEGTFLPFYMEEIGISSGKYALLLGYRSILEIPVLFLYKWLKTKLSTRKLLIIAPLLQLIEGLMFCFVVHSLFGMIVAMTFMGIGNGLFIGAAYNYVYEISPDDVKASAQAFYAAMVGFGSIFGSLFGGFVMDAVGGRMFYLINGAIFLLASLCLLPSEPLRKKQAV